MSETAGEDARSAMYETLIAVVLESADRSADEIRSELRARHPGLHQEIDLALEVCSLGREAELLAWPQAGQVLGDYRLDRELGRGSFGIVFEAWDDRLRRFVALKLLPPESAGRNGGGFEDALAEARSAAAIDHPNVVRVHAVGRFEGGLGFIDTQLAGDPAPTPEAPHAVARGQSLADLSAARALGLRRIASIVRDAARGVAAAHARGVVHRDLKPANLIVTPSGRTLVSDFGLAGVARHPELSERAPALVGSPAFMAPEQARGEPATPASDVYGLGATLYALALGRAPFASQADSPAEAIEDVLDQVGDVARAPLPIDDGELPRTLRLIIERATAVQPEDRYASADLLARDLQSWLEHRPASVESAGRWLRFRLFLRRNRVASALASVLFGLAAAGTLAFVLNLSQARAEAEAGLERYRQMADVRRVRELIAEGEALWPRRPFMIGRMKRWRETTQAILGNEASHRRAVEQLGAARSGDGEPRFADDEEAWRHEVLSGLLKDFVRLESLLGDVERRVKVAEVMRQATLEDEEMSARWARCIASVARMLVYDGISLEPIVGLVPLGRDASSGLWEFWHVGSGKEPAWKGSEDAGHVAFGDECGIVLVLAPVVGDVQAGGQRVDAAAPRFDPQVRINERPVLRSRVGPFLVSKFEMTQYQWKLIMGNNPSYYRPPRGKRERFTPSHPVENMRWRDAREVVRRYGLSLPTEIEWEAAARAGTTSIWWTGDTVETLAGAGNLRDVTVAGYSTNDNYERLLSDGRRVHAPVGSYRANAWGLHDVVGNVGEWCLYPIAPGENEKDPFVVSRHPPGKAPRLGYHAVRGGSFQSLAVNARSASRATVSLGAVSSTVGLRPVLPLDPPR